MKELQKKGFVEGASRAGVVFATSADIVEGLRSDVDYQGKPRSDFQPLAGRSFVFAASNVSVAEWLITSDDRLSGILLRCSTHRSGVPPAEREAMADALVGTLERLRAEIFADRRTPLRKLLLPAPIGRFTHLVVLSPVAENMTISRDVNIANRAFARSVYRAFPAFECEATGQETVAAGRARVVATPSRPPVGTVPPIPSSISPT